MQSEPKVRIDVFSHGIRVYGFGHEVKQRLYYYIDNRLSQYDTVPNGHGGWRKERIRSYCSANRDRTEFRFHRNCLDEILMELSQIRLNVADGSIVVNEIPMYEPITVDLKLTDNRPFRDYQIPQYEYLISEGKTKLCSLVPGGGKTLCALRASTTIGHRLAIVIRPMYIQRWLDDITAGHDLDRKDIMVVNGSKELMGLMCLAQEGKLDAKVIIISNKTLQRYLKSYASMEDFIYPYRPEEFYQALGVGVRLIDEVHQDFHLNFLQDCYSHVPKTISLSGTMESDNRFDNEMYRLMFPMAERGPVYHQPPYIQLVNLWYNFSSQTQRLIRFTGHRRQYSHTALEKSLRRHKWLQAKYIGMIVELVGDIFVTDHEHGQKCAIYCATVDLCAKVRDALRAMYPQFKIDKYTQEEPYEVLLGCDIAVTTLQSAGTAVDIPNLKVILSTVALSSKQANEQLIKRLRPLKDWPEVTPTFYFLSALCIPKHLEYANGKRGKLNGKVLGIKEERTEWNL